MSWPRCQKKSGGGTVACWVALRHYSSHRNGSSTIADCNGFWHADGTSTGTRQGHHTSGTYQRRKIVGRSKVVLVEYEFSTSKYEKVHH